MSFLPCNLLEKVIFAFLYLCFNHLTIWFAVIIYLLKWEHIYLLAEFLRKLLGPSHVGLIKTVDSDGFLAFLEAEPQDFLNWFRITSCSIFFLFSLLRGLFFCIFFFFIDSSWYFRRQLTITRLNVRLKGALKAFRLAEWSGFRKSLEFHA